MILPKNEPGQDLCQHVLSDMMDPTIGQYMARKTVVDSVVLGTLGHIAKNVMLPYVSMSPESVLNYFVA